MGSVSRSSNNIFQMPSWGSTKVLRCMKVHNTNPTPTPQPNFPTSPSSDQALIARLGDNLHLPARKFHDAVTQKSTLDFSLAADKMKSDFVRPKEAEKAPEKPWNLRARNPVKGNTSNSDPAVAKPPRAEARNSSPRLLRGSGGAAASEGGVAAASTSSGVKRKFSISLSKEEIEEDFMAMTGRKLPRRPRKNPRNVQKFLDPLFPGQWLAEIDVDTYKVADDPGKGKIKTPAQLEAALAFLWDIASENLELDVFEEACGVGVEVSLVEMEQAVDEIFEHKKNSIIEQRYRANVGELFGHVRKKQPWSDPKIVENLIDAKLHALLGERIAADNEKPAKKKKDKPVKLEEKKILEDTAQPVALEEKLNTYAIFPYKVHTEVFFSDRPVLRACNTKEMLSKHLTKTGGKVLTRFPPEPNGYLHIGHAKAMFVDFGLAKERGGGCYLRYDDTNPEAEKKEYIDHIEEIVQWMGWEPFKITYTSDYFQELYDLAVQLIQRGHAYVEHQTTVEIKEYREKKMNSPWRHRPITESLKLFSEMKKA